MPLVGFRAIILSTSTILKIFSLWLILPQIKGINVPSAYIETTIPSYYTARSARSVLQISRQISTQEWWDNGHSGFQLYTAMETVNEIQRGDSELAKARLKMMHEIEILPLTDESANLAKLLVDKRIVPEKAAADAVHIAVAATHKMDFLVTWNFKHIANPHIRDKMRLEVEAFGARMPIMCNPEELSQNDYDSK